MQLLFIFVILLLFLINKLVKSYNDPVWKKMPGPSHKWPIFGFLFDIINSDISFHHTRWAKEFGSIFRYYIFGFNTVMVSDPALVKHVLLNNNLFDKNIFHYRFIGNALGRGLVTEWDEVKHKYHRSIISPAFAHHHLRVLVPIFQRKAAILVEDWVKVAGSGIPISIKDDIAKATSDAIGESAFGCQLNSQRNNSASSIYNIFAAVMGNGVLNWLAPSFRIRTRAINRLDDQVSVMIRQKTEKRINKEKENENEIQKDLLDIMMDCKNEDGAMLTKSELIDQTKTFLMAGYETSSVCILWTLYLLAKHSNVQQKLADEVLQVLGRDRQPSAEDIDAMPYLYKVLRESLRFYPPIPIVLRKVNQDCTLGGYSISKGTPVLINIYHQHHNSPVWNKPEEFNPERWSAEESETNLVGSYIPFIMGARNCIGSRFAMLEVRVMLAMIIQKLSWEREQGAVDPRPTGKISMVPRNPICLLFSLRN